MTTLDRPVLAVELSDGSSHIVTILNPSLVAWDRTRALRKWPTVQEAPILWMTFITWHHLKAAGLVSCEYEEYEGSVCVAVGDPPSEDQDEPAATGEVVEAVDPTQPALDPASPSSSP